MTSLFSVSETAKLDAKDRKQVNQPALEIEIIDLEDPCDGSADNIVFYRSTCTTCSTS